MTKTTKSLIILLLFLGVVIPCQGQDDKQVMIYLKKLEAKIDNLEKGQTISTDTTMVVPIKKDMVRYMLQQIASIQDEQIAQKALIDSLLFSLNGVSEPVPVIAELKEQDAKISAQMNSVEEQLNKVLSFQADTAATKQDVEAVLSEAKDASQEMMDKLKKKKKGFLWGLFKKKE